MNKGVEAYAQSYGTEAEKSYFSFISPIHYLKRIIYNTSACSLNFLKGVWDRVTVSPDLDIEKSI